MLRLLVLWIKMKMERLQRDRSLALKLENDGRMGAQGLTASRTLEL